MAAILSIFELMITLSSVSPGNWHVTWPGRYKIADTYFQYTRSYDQPEQLRAPGPLDQEVIIEVGQGHDDLSQWEMMLHAWRLL